MTSTRTLKRGMVAAMVALLAALTLMTIAVPAVSAHEPDSDIARERAFDGFRTVEAAGSGIAHLHGRYVQQGSIGAGALIVSANAEVRVDGFERRIVIGDGSVLYLGVRGHFRIAGDEISSTLIGAGIKFEATGSGHARFSGNGEYSVNGGPRQPWS